MESKCPMYMYMYMYIYMYIHVHVYRVSVSLFTLVYEMFDLDPASWAALVAQLVRASVRSAECRGFKSHLRQLIFHFFIASGVCLSFFPSQVLSCICICTLYMF